MEASSWICGLLFGSALLAAIGAAPGSDLYDVDPLRLAADWEKERISPPDPFTLTHAALQQKLDALAARFPSVMRLESIGRSVQGREIRLLQIGEGSDRLLLWSQMHGDEPTATSALLDLAQYLGAHRDEPWIARILRRYTLLCIPMLNPDGAEKGHRRNAQGIDINRDARLLQSPEGRLLKDVRDKYTPILGFNLHNQNSLTTVGETGRVATIALLAVAAEVPAAADKGGADSTAPEAAGLLAKRVAAVLYEALSPFVYGHISRYDESFNPRAFGDNLSIWGTPVVLVESGGNPAGKPPDFGVQLNFIGLLAALDSLATGRVERANPAVFDALLMNSDTPIFDLMLCNAWICTGTGVPLFRGDIAVRRDVRAGSEGEAIIADLGDLGVFSAHETIDCSGKLVTPGLIAWAPTQPPFSTGADGSWMERGVLTVLETLEAGGEVSLPTDWKSASRDIHWSFVVLGASGKSDAAEALALGRWLASGGRAWIRPAPVRHRPADDVASWFGVESMTPELAAGFRFPDRLEGEPSQAIPRWTSEAARRFRLLRRGVIEVGSIADLVLWSAPAGEPPADLKDCRPSRLIVSGRLAGKGRFIGR